MSITLADIELHDRHIKACRKQEKQKIITNGWTEKIEKLEEENAKLKKVWKMFQNLYGQFMIPVEGNRALIGKLMIDLEIDNDYFPGEEESNE